MNARTISSFSPPTLFAACSREDGHAHAPGDTHSATGDSGKADITMITVTRCRFRRGGLVESPCRSVEESPSNRARRPAST